MPYSYFRVSGCRHSHEYNHKFGNVEFSACCERHVRWLFGKLMEAGF